MGLTDRYGAHRRAIEALYEGRCTVQQYKTAPGTIAGTEGGAWEPVPDMVDLPCYLEQERLTAAGDGDIATTAQAVTLILAPEVAVSTGARIVVTQHGVTSTYEQAGKAAVCGTHQEIPLEVSDRGKHGRR